MPRFLLLWLLLALCWTAPLLAAPPARPPGPPPAPLARALELRGSGDLAGARRVLEEHLARAPEDARARYLLGVILLESGLPGEGLEALLETLRREPGMPEARASLAGAVQARVYELADRGECDQAEAVLVHLEDEPTRLFLEGAVHLERWRRTGQAEERKRALEDWTRSRDLKPVSAVSELLAGISAFDGRDYARAAEHFEYALRIRGRNRYARLWLGMAQAALGRYPEALGTLEACQPHFGGNPALHRLLGDVHVALALAVASPPGASAALPPDPAELDRAQACYQRSLELWPESPQGQAALGDLWRLRGRLEEAMACYSRALELKEDGDLATRAGLLFLEAGRLPQAQAAFQVSLDAALAGPASAQQARALVELALCRVEQGDAEGARALAAGKTASLPRTDPRRLLLVGALGSSAEREAALRQALLDQGPQAGLTHLQAWEALGRLEEERGQGVRALRCYAEALRLAAPGTPRAEALGARFQEVRQRELDEIAAWEANNGLVFLVDVVTGSSRSESLQARKEALRSLEPGPVGAGREPWKATPLAWPKELEGDLEPIRAAGTGREVDPPESWLGP